MSLFFPSQRSHSDKLPIVAGKRNALGCSYMRVSRERLPNVHCMASWQLAYAPEVDKRRHKDPFKVFHRLSDIDTKN